MNHTPAHRGFLDAHSEMRQNCTCTARFSLIKSFIIYGKLTDADAALLCGLKNFNGVESHNNQAFLGLVNKLHS